MAGTELNRNQTFNHPTSTQVSITASNALQARNVQQPRPTSDVSAGPAKMLADIGRALAEFDAEVAPVVPQAPPVDPVIAVLMKNAKILMEAGEGRLAFNILRNVLIRAPQHAEALKSMGVCLKEAGRWEEALKCFRAYAKIDQSNAAQAAVAEIYYLLERDEVALAAYRDILKNVVSETSLLFDIYKNVGNIHTRAGDFEAAEEVYDKAYTIRPESDVLLVNYGTLEIQRGNWDAAVTRFRSAVSINPDSDRGWVGLAMVHRTMGDLELAKANLECALDINISNRTALRLIVDWAAQDHDFDLAVRRLQDYIAKDGGEDAEMCFTFAKILVQAGRLRDARLECERVMALDPLFDGAEALARALDKHMNSASEKA